MHLKSEFANFLKKERLYWTPQTKNTNISIAKQNLRTID